MSSMNYCQIGYVDCLLDAVDYLILCLLFMQYYGVVLSVTLQGFLARLAPFHRLLSRLAMSCRLFIKSLYFEHDK